MSGLGELFGLDGQVALVTGASSGLGAEGARALARAGADVGVVARRGERASPPSVVRSATRVRAGMRRSR
jgi:NAD(P)-dependent dehydrogenase (short-subunit alcohol dehydrogenase family)